MSEQEYGEIRPMSQRAAAEKAWRAMEAAEVALIETDYVETRAYVDVAKGWAAVAGQFGFELDAAAEPGGVLRWEHARPIDLGTITRIDDTLRINPITETMTETVSMPRVVDPASTHPVMCYCAPFGDDGHVRGPACS